MEKITISTPYIKLDQLLKWSGIVTDGSDAKILIQEGFVLVDDVQELRRGRKCYPDMVVTVKTPQDLKQLIVAKE
ncbi:MAG: RNA-binding S4 domain-containing protein [Hyphomonadaceae bacterium]|nr:RNA-binding S4 domain-containing protein [Clostridia bacterium]